MAAVAARLFGSVFSHIGRHKMAYGLTAATLGGTAAYDHYKKTHEQPASESAPTPDPTKPQSMMA